MKKNWFFLLFAALIMLVGVFAFDHYCHLDADEQTEAAIPVAEHEFIGASKCSLCHKKEESGMQFPIWQESLHAKAYETLGTDAAKEIAAKQGIDDPQKSGQCLKCHSTAYYFIENRVTESIAVEEGISCETCHGPGKDYMKKSVMEDIEAAKQAGLIIPDANTCILCHNEKSPNYKPFNFEEFWAKIKHPIPESK